MSAPTLQKVRIRYEVLVLSFESCVLLLTFAAYMYCIASSVAQVVLRQELMVAIQEAETKVSELEADYFAKSNKISEETAAAYGLVALADPVYLTVPPEVGDKLTRND